MTKPIRDLKPLEEKPYIGQVVDILAVNIKDRTDVFVYKSAVVQSVELRPGGYIIEAKCLVKGDYPDMPKYFPMYAHYNVPDDELPVESRQALANRYLGSCCKERHEAILIVNLLQVMGPPPNEECNLRFVRAKEDIDKVICPWCKMPAKGPQIVAVAAQTENQFKAAAIPVNEELGGS